MYPKSHKEKEDRYSEVGQRLALAKRHLKKLQNHYRQKGKEIKLLAASKNHSALAIKTAYRAGQICFGENYLQEALQKQRDLIDLDIEWHFIGKVQSNKTSDIANNFSWVHGLERLKIARRLHEQRRQDLPPLNVLIQVKQRGENKAGIEPDNFQEFAEEILGFQKLSLRGIMYFPPAGGNFEENREAYSNMIELTHNLPMADTLSMGTSSDLEAAVAAGTTLVRLGTSIFGLRD